MDTRKGFIGAIIGLTPRWRLAARAKGPLAEDGMGEHWNWKQLTTQNSGIQNATKAQTMLDFFHSTSRKEHSCSTYVMSLKKELLFNFHVFHFLSKKKNEQTKTKKKEKKNKKQKKHNDIRTHFLNWKPNAGYATGAKPKRKEEKQEETKQKKK